MNKSGSISLFSAEHRTILNNWAQDFNLAAVFTLIK